jgi:hypothetical protein
MAAEGLDSDTAHRVAFECGVEDGVGHLITDLVRVTGGHGLCRIMRKLMEHDMGVNPDKKRSPYGGELFWKVSSLLRVRRKHLVLRLVAGGSSSRISHRTLDTYGACGDSLTGGNRGARWDNEAWQSDRDKL